MRGGEKVKLILSPRKPQYPYTPMAQPTNTYKVGTGIVPMSCAMQIELYLFQQPFLAVHRLGGRPLLLGITPVVRSNTKLRATFRT